MLLLVLILVLIAFGLLLVGFLSASVLWAWVSVAVSIGAAGVLLFDTLQRRSVVRAGDDAGGEPLADAEAERTTSVATPARPSFGTSEVGRGDIDPVTEVIPVIRPAAPQGSGVDPRFDPDADAQQTVMMPAVQPSGSPVGPPGATPGQTPSSESSSPSVTLSKGEPPVPDGSAGGDQATVVVRAAGPDTVSDLAATTATPATPAATTTAPSAPSDDPGPADGRPDPAAGERADSGIATAGGAAVIAGATGSAAGSQPTDAPSADPGGSDDVGDVEATTVVAPPRRDEGIAATAGPPHEAPGSLFVSGPASNGMAPTGLPDPVAAEPPPPVASEAVAEPTAQVPAAKTPAAEPSPAEPSPAELSPAELSPADVPEIDGEAPEEQSDPQAAAVVAGLEDEVLVIDEHPRYHVTGCRAVVAVALIPLPVREAVELGFTPCGWCSPDHTLASRHRATAR